MNQRFLHIAVLQAENEQWGGIVAQIFAHLQVKLAHEEMHIEPQRSFIINTLHLVAMIGDYAVEQQWDEDELYTACIEAVKEFAKKSGYLPQYLH